MPRSGEHIVVPVDGDEETAVPPSRHVSTACKVLVSAVLVAWSLVSMPLVVLAFDRFGTGLKGMLVVLAVLVAFVPITVAMCHVDDDDQVKNRMYVVKEGAILQVASQAAA